MKAITMLRAQSRSIHRNVLFRLLSGTAALPDQGQKVTDEEKLYSQIVNGEGVYEEEEQNMSKSTDEVPKKKKKKWAIMMVYCGHGYHGLQVNKFELPTIEGVLIQALIKAQCVPETCSYNLKEMRFHRCARTDKGVSALAQVVSLKLFKPYTDPVEKINSFLPPAIRVLGIKRVTKGFNPQHTCDSRTYSYTLPTFALSRGGVSFPDSGFRLPREDFHLVSGLLSVYKGTHNFHNFTCSKLATDKSAYRHIIDISCSDPFLLHGVEFIRIHIRGQSFMLHQIRKMVCLIIAVARGLVPADLLIHSMQMEKVNIPLAPGLGLVLEFTHFDSYNRRFFDSPHEPITWEDFLPAREAFREEKVMPVIVEGELRDLSMCHWLQQLSMHNFMNIADSSKMNSVILPEECAL
ncbi:pseudouridylate synthase 1 homolog [Hyperolius riggenbachi]|uniref:pseudouridylate synthase 1 homolog n=1 Tax=Hyperolius riggenbachi TaxID=752182 RepID=UPI0035A3D3CC